jgi:hypothetical protein
MILRSEASACAYINESHTAYGWYEKKPEGNEPRERPRHRWDDTKLIVKKWDETE